MSGLLLDSRGKEGAGVCLVTTFVKSWRLFQDVGSAPAHTDTCSTYRAFKLHTEKPLVFIFSPEPNFQFLEHVILLILSSTTRFFIGPDLLIYIPM